MQFLKKVWSHAKWMVGKGFKIQGGGQELSVMVMAKKFYKNNAVTFKKS